MSGFENPNSDWIELSGSENGKVIILQLYEFYKMRPDFKEVQLND